MIRTLPPTSALGAIAGSLGSSGRSSTISSAPNEDPLCRLFLLFFLLAQKRKKSNPNATAAVAEPATATPAICAAVRIGCGAAVEEVAAAAVNDGDGDGNVIKVFITRVVPESVKSIGEPEIFEGDPVAVIRPVGELVVVSKGEIVEEETDADADVKDGKLPPPDVVLTVLPFPSTIVEGLAIVAVKVLWVMGKDLGIPAQASYAVVKSDDCGFVHADATQRRAPSPNVKPDALSFVHRQDRSCGSEQMDDGNDVAIKSPRQLCAQVGMRADR